MLDPATATPAELEVTFYTLVYDHRPIPRPLWSALVRSRKIATAAQRRETAEALERWITQV